MSVIKFTELPDKLKYPPSVKAELSIIHSAIIEEVTSKYSGTFKEKNNITKAMNAWTYWLIESNAMPSGDVNYLTECPDIDDDECRQKLGSLYLMPKNINWNIEVTEVVRSVMLNTATPVVEIVQQDNVREPVVQAETLLPTPKEDLYIKPPVIPRFDTKSPWIRGVTDDGLELAIYPSIPAIPTKQNEISITTDVNKMTSQDLRRLYPNVFIQTRSPILYTPVQGLSYHKKLGVILPIEGFTETQIVDNMIRYPHLYKLAKIVDGSVVSFYSTIEIDGELHKISDCWSSLPESTKIPFNTEFVKEYVVRRYLLERDIKGIVHKYPMHGTLMPFLTLVSTPEDYISWGYTNVEEIARDCVSARVSYKSSRNPILRRLKHE